MINYFAWSFIGGLASYFSNSVSIAFYKVSLKCASKWFVSGTGWGGDDAVLEALENEKYLRKLLRHMADDLRTKKIRNDVEFFDTVINGAEGKE